MLYRECPHCGAHLDPGERCDCQDRKEDAPDAPGTPSHENGIATTASLSNRAPDVNDCLRLKEIRQQTGMMAKDVALVIRDVFPKFNRQLLAQCEAPEKYGVIIHPSGLQLICTAYSVALPPEDAPSKAVITPSVPRKHPNRKLPRKVTLHMRNEDFDLLEKRVREDGYSSGQAWLYAVVMNALHEEASHGHS